MSTTYTGVATTIGPAGTVQITAPADGDALTAASNNVGANKLADYTKELVNRALFKDVASGSGGDSVSGQVKIASGGQILVQSGGDIDLASGGNLTGATGSLAAFTSATSGAAPFDISNSAGVAGRAGHISEGNLKFTTAANPASTDAFTNELMGANIVKAWGEIAWALGAPTITTSCTFNLTSINSPSNGTIDLTFASTISSPIMIANAGTASWTVAVGGAANRNRLIVYDTVTGTVILFGSTTGRLNFIVMGLQ